MKSAPSIRKSSTEIDLSNYLVDIDYINRAIFPLSLTSSDYSRYLEFYEEARRVAEKAQEAISSIRCHPSSQVSVARQLDQTVEIIGQDLSWSVGVFYRMIVQADYCEDIAKRESIFELTSLEIMIYGTLIDKVAQTYFLNNRILPPDTRNHDVSDLIEKAEKLGSVSYVVFDDTLQALIEVDSKPPYAIIRTQICLFIERKAYNKVLNDCRGGLARLLKSTGGTAVILEH